MPRHSGLTGLLLAGISGSLVASLHAGQAPVDHEVEGALEPPVRVTGTAALAQEPGLSEARLDQLLAPIALYPDSVLSQILVASNHPLDVVEADRWRQANQHFDAEDAIAAAETRDWHPSVKALLPFPDLLSRMSADLQWTRDLGEAFLLAESDVMERIQYLRHDAWDTGHLRGNADTRVERRTDAIYVEPVVREVVRLPQYEPRRVYSSGSWSSHPPVNWHSTRTSIRRDPIIHWGPAVSVSHHHYHSNFVWPQRRVVVVHSPPRRHRSNIIRHDTTRVISKPGYHSGINRNRSRQSHTSIHIHKDISLPYRSTPRYGGSRHIRKATDNRPAWNRNHRSNRDQRNRQHRREMQSEWRQRANPQRSERRNHRERNRKEQESRRNRRQGSEARIHNTRRSGMASSHREARASQRRIP